MQSNSEQEIQDMFSRIAPRYELLNHLMTGWQDIRWRRWVVDHASLPDEGQLLDLGTGTGDLVRETLNQYPRSQPVGLDFTLDMMRLGRERHNHKDSLWVGGNAQSLPFPGATFHAVISGFLLRNVTNLERCLRECYRVLKPGGKFVALDTTRPPQNILTPLIKFHLHTVIPTLGKWLTGQQDAYTYLPRTTEHFLRAERLLAYLAVVGFKKLEYQRFMFGTVAVHWGEK